MLLSFSLCVGSAKLFEQATPVANKKQAARIGATLGIAAESILPASSSLDAQLGQGAGERSVDGSDFFGREFFVETRFGASPRFFCFRLVDAVGRNGEIRQDGDATGGDFDESFAGRDEQITAVLAHDHFARHHL
jgi:hypothetical protein